MDVHSGLATVLKSQRGDDDQAKRQNDATSTETRTDLKLLLECIKCHMNDATVQRDSLLTIAAMCSGSEEAQEFFREIGGINFVLNLLTSVKDAVRIAALYMLGCACEKNVFSQKRLCTKAVFKFLYCQLTSSDTDISLKRIAAFLILCLVTNNGEGQNLARTSKCLDAILQMFRTSHPFTDCSRLPGQMWLETHTNNDQLELWTSITSTLCGCVNNPQNDENQQLCASAFPTAVTLLSKTKNPRIIRLLSSFLSLTVANSVSNQDRFGILGGLEILVSLLQGVVESLLREPEHDYIQAALQLANLFVSCITDSEQNHASLVNLNLVPLLVQLLSMEFIDLDAKLKIIITLGHLTEKCERSQRQLLESDGLGLLIHIMTENQDEEFNKAAMFLLSTCIKIVSCLEGECNTNIEKLLTPKKQKTAEKRDSARVDRASFYDAVHSKRESTWTQQDLNVRIRSLDRKMTGALVDGVHTANVITTNSKDKLSSPSHSQLSDAEVISDLLMQLQEERSKREQLETEKEEIETQAKIKENTKNVINEKAEAITRELERQYKEQQHKHEDKQEKVLVMKTPEKLSEHCSMNDLEQKISALEKTIHCLSKTGDHSISADQVKKQINSQQSIPQTMNKSVEKPDSYKLVPDVLPRSYFDGMCKGCNDSHNTMATMNTGYLQESAKRQTSDQNNGLVRSAEPHKNESQNKGQKSASTGKDIVFRVPTAPVPRLRQVNRSSKKDETLPSLNDTKHCFMPPHEYTHMESDRDSHTSNTTYQSTEMSFTASDMALFQPRVQLVDIMHSGNLSAQPGNRSFKLKHPVHNASSLSRPVSELTRPKIRQIRASDDNRSSSKNVFTSSVSQSDLAGCAPPVNRPLLNSRNFLYTLERSRHTCSEHRDLQRMIKQDIQRRMIQKHYSSPKSVTDTSFTLSRNVRSALRTKRFPHAISSTLPKSLDRQFKQEAAKWSSPSSSKSKPIRRKRKNFTEQEIENLIEGVAKKGKHWNAILWGYEFQPGRTSVDLKDKYKRMQADSDSVGVIKSSRQPPPLSGKSRQQNIDPTWHP